MISRLLGGIILVSAGVWGYVDWALPLSHKVNEVVSMNIIFIFPTFLCVGLIGVGLAVIFSARYQEGVP